VCVLCELAKQASHLFVYPFNNDFKSEPHYLSEMNKKKKPTTTGSHIPRRFIYLRIIMQHQREQWEWKCEICVQKDNEDWKWGKKSNGWFNTRFFVRNEMKISFYFPLQFGRQLVARFLRCWADSDSTNTHTYTTIHLYKSQLHSLFSSCRQSDERSFSVTSQ